MSIYRAIPAVVVLAALALSGHAEAQVPGASPRMFSFGIGGGVSVPVSDAKDFLDQGFNGLAYARVTPPFIPVSLGVNVTFSKFDFSDAAVSTSVPGVTGGNTQVLAGLADAKINFLNLGLVKTYLLVGVGVYNVDTELQGTGGSTASDTRFGINGGGGVRLQLGRIGAFIQGRVDNVYTEEGGVIDTKSIQMVPVTFGLEF